MTKMQTSLVSLVAAVPGGLLAYGMVMSFLNYASQSPLSFRIISGITLVTAVLLALLPLAILAYGGPKKAKSAAAPGSTGPLAVSAPNSVVDASEVESIDDLEVAGETNDADFTMAESFDEFSPDGEVAEVTGEDGFEVDAMETFDGVAAEEVPADDFDLEAMESFDGPIEDIPMEDFAEEEPPAKKKKKK